MTIDIIGRHEPIARPLSRAAVRFPVGADQIRLARRRADQNSAGGGGGGGIRRQFVSVHIKGQIK